MLSQQLRLYQGKTAGYLEIYFSYGIRILLKLLFLKLIIKNIEHTFLPLMSLAKHSKE